MEYDKLKQSILAGEISVKQNYLPAQNVVFSIMFHKKEILQPTIEAVMNEPVEIIDPLAEHRNDLLKAIESSIWEDVHAKDTANRIITLDMQRQYFKRRNRNRSVYYGAKELSGQTVKSGQYENLNQVSITFIFENNTTPNTPPVAKIQLTNIETHEVYTNLLTLYEVNLNRINENSPVNPGLITLKDFLTIKSHEDLCKFIKTHNTSFAKKLTTGYMDAVIEEKTLIKVEGSKRFMSKIDFEKLTKAHLEGMEEGMEKGVEKGINVSAKIIQALKANIPIPEISETYQMPAPQIEELRQALAM